MSEEDKEQKPSKEDKKAAKKAAKEKKKAAKANKEKDPNKSALKTLYWLFMIVLVSVVVALGYEAALTAINGITAQ